MDEQPETTPTHDEAELNQAIRLIMTYVNDTDTHAASIDSVDAALYELRDMIRFM